MLVEQIGRELALPTSYVTSLARSASHLYKSYQIPKRSGGVRVIYHPSKPLKAVQRWLLRHVIARLPVHSACFSYRKGTNTAKNAAFHAASRFLLRMDFVDFFPSITQADIAKYIQSRPVYFPEWKEDDIDSFCRFVCRNGALAIGAPSSPGLSNALCYDLDQLLSDMAIKHDCIYSRYADDTFFSTVQPEVLRSVETDMRELCKKLPFPTLTVNEQKIRHSSKKRARKVTGIILGSDGKIHVGRQYKRIVRGMIHKIEGLNPAERLRLAGLIAYVIGIDPVFLNSLITKYGIDRVQTARYPTKLPSSG